MKQEYENLYGQMKAPTEWKDSIKAQMKDALLKEEAENASKEAVSMDIKQDSVSNRAQDKKNNKSNKVIRFSYAAGTVLAAAAVLAISINVMNNSASKDARVENVAQDEVMLGNAEETAKEQEFDAGLQETDGQSFDTSDNEQEISLVSAVHTVGDGSVRVIQKGKESTLDEESGNKKQIENVDVYIKEQIGNVEGKHQATFNLNGMNYLFESKNLTIEAFEEYLAQFISSIE